MARKLDDLGRIVLPVEMRRLLGIAPGDALDISVDSGAIVLRKVESRCVFCDDPGDDLRGYRHKQVCPTCARELAEREREDASDRSGRQTAPGPDALWQPEAPSAG